MEHVENIIALADRLGISVNDAFFLLVCSAIIFFALFGWAISFFADYGVTIYDACKGVVKFIASKIRKEKEP